MSAVQEGVAMMRLWFGCETEGKGEYPHSGEGLKARRCGCGALMRGGVGAGCADW